MESPGDAPDALRPSPPTRTRKRAALLVALGADALQMAIAPLFGEGFASPLNDVLDVIVAGVLIKLLGFHWPLLPALAAEAVPVLDLAPTWTASVLVVTSSGRRRWWLVAVWAALVALLGIVALASFSRRAGR